MKTVGVVLLGILLILGLSWGIYGNDFFMYKVFAPKYEQVRRQTFEQTKSYNQGMVQELQNMQFEYIRATADQKDALASIIIHRSADFPLEMMPTDLRLFINDLKMKRRF